MYEEFDCYLQKAKDGSQTAKIKIVKMLDPLLKSSIKKYCPLYDYYDDLYQDGVLIILNCIKTHSQAKGSVLSYIKSYLKYHYLTTFKYLLTKEKSTEEEQEDDNTINQIADITNIEKTYLEKEETKTLIQNLKTLTPKQLQIIKLYYFYNLDLKEIAEKLKISKWTVVHTKKRAIEKLRRKYDNKQDANSL